MNSNCKQYNFINISCIFSSESYFNLERHQLRYRHKRKYYVYINVKHDEHMRSSSVSKLYELEGGPSNELCQLKSSYIPAVEVRTIAHGDDESE